MKTVLLAGLGAVLLGAVVLQVGWRPRETAPVSPRAPLAGSLPRDLAGWRATDEPLGLTEVSSEAMRRTLNLDDHVYRRYQRGAAWFTVYAAYWAPGRMPTRLVASHTPDRCWTENGLRCVAMRFRQVLPAGDGDFLPAEVRTFTAAGSGDPIHVVYWHTVAGVPYDYGDRFNAVPDPWRWWKDTVAQALQGSREQLFVRIASPLPQERLWQEAGVGEILRHVANLGLRAPAAP